LTETFRSDQVRKQFRLLEHVPTGAVFATALTAARYYADRTQANLRFVPVKKANRCSDEKVYHDARRVTCSEVLAVLDAVRESVVTSMVFYPADAAGRRVADIINVTTSTW
jgi:hypothetical protein